MLKTMATVAACATLFLTLVLAPKTGAAETLNVKSADPFNFVQAISDPNAGGTIDLNVDLVLPDASSRHVPAILFVHGAGGPQPHHQTWLTFFRKHGIATAYADHFKPRGKGAAVGSHIRLTGAAMAVDALNILKSLSAHPRIDANRIAIMGASKGGGVALYTAWRPLQQAIAPGHQFAAHIPLYPTCMHWDEPDTTGKPILLLLAENDNWTGVDQCLESVEFFRKSGIVEIEAKIYADALHGFDSGASNRKIPNAFNVLNCRFSIGKDGKDYGNGVFMDSPESKRKALGGCIRRGVEYGGNAHALKAAKQDVRDFLRTNKFE